MTLNNTNDPHSPNKNILLILSIFSSIWLLSANWAFICEFSKRRPGTMLVFFGVIGEGVEIGVKIFSEHTYKANERKFDIFGGTFWILVVVGLAMEIPDASKSDKDAANATVRANGLANELAALQSKTIELAHQYDLSTNALAEANARLASVRPIKDKLIGWLKLHLMPDFWDDLAKRQSLPKFIDITVSNVPQSALFQLEAMQDELGARQYCPSVNPGADIFMLQGIGFVQTVDVTISSELLK